jgi:hypothetical protein
MPHMFAFSRRASIALSSGTCVRDESIMRPGTGLDNQVIAEIR